MTVMRAKRWSRWSSRNSDARLALGWCWKVARDVRKEYCRACKCLCETKRGLDPSYRWHGCFLSRRQRWREGRKVDAEGGEGVKRLCWRVLRPKSSWGSPLEPFVQIEWKVPIVLLQEAAFQEKCVMEFAAKWFAAITRGDC